MGGGITGGGGSSSSESGSRGSTRPPISINPVQGVLANMFGVGTEIADGGFRLTGDAPQFGEIFGAESFSDLGNFLQEDIFEGGSDFLRRTFDKSAGVVDSAQDSILSFLDDGNPVNVDPLVDQALADVNERIAPLTGLFSTDIAREGTRTASQLRVGAEERARDRQLGATGAATSVAAGPANLLASILGTSEQNVLQGTTSGRALTLLQAMAGITPTSAIVGSDQSSNASGSAKSGQGGIG